MAVKVNRVIYNSLIFKLILGTLILTIPMVFFLIFDNYYAIKTLHNKVAEYNSNTVNLYMNQIDSDLNNIDSYILNVITFNADVLNLNSADENLRVLSKIKFQNELTNARSLYKMADVFFVYSKSSGDHFNSHSSRISYNETLNISDFISKAAKDNVDYNSMGWMPISIGSSNYIYRIISVDNMYLGTWIKVETLMSPLIKINLQREGSILFVTSDGKPMINQEFIKNNHINLTGDLSHYYFSGEENSHMVIGKPSEVGKFSLIAVTNEKNMLQGLDLIQTIIFFIAIISLVSIPVTLYILYRWIFKPVKKLEYAINMIENGNLDYRIENHKFSNEFLVVNKAFNNMVSQIKQLKIEVYEEQIQKQKSELEYLQMQIRPHFYINALNNIYSMAQMKEFQLIQDMVLYLSDYLRYLFRSSFLLVSLESELKHVKNYLQIEKIHSGETLVCNIDAEEHLMMLKIPPLVLQTFVENIIKHGMKPFGVITVMIKISLIKNQDEEYAHIKIQDNGAGFSEAALNQINNSINNNTGEKIGIWNVKQRLNLIYGERCQIIASNNDNMGACIDIYIPVEKEVK
ncbi:histidine kinase [Clostridium sp. C2-6-12]|uniref:sensor histidine kinase n=1 Tax=Clostridium sp. C2-6-12 TaxID=2698832 RepID=UPI001370CE33|nr:histidine kinase [Clostridium sp. C2-6-12]